MWSVVPVFLSHSFQMRRTLQISHFSRRLEQHERCYDQRFPGCEGKRIFNSASSATAWSFASNAAASVQRSRSKQDWKADYAHWFRGRSIGNTCAGTRILWKRCNVALFVKQCNFVGRWQDLFLHWDGVHFIFMMINLSLMLSFVRDRKLAMYCIKAFVDK